MDKRIAANLQVKNKLFSALIETGKTKPLSKITVTELIEKAGVARSSFYRNFQSIEDIVQYGIHEAIDEYDHGCPIQTEDLQNRLLILYKFEFYKKHASLILSFHEAQTSPTLLDVLNDYMLTAYGDMPSNSIARYEIYFYSGAFYNMLIAWLTSGLKESPEQMTDEFLRIVNADAILQD